jgi:hypothetical protein
MSPFARTGKRRRKKNTKKRKNKVPVVLVASVVLFELDGVSLQQSQ